MARGRTIVPLDNDITRGVEGRRVWDETRLFFAYAYPLEASRAGSETGIDATYEPLGDAHRAALELAFAAVERVTALRFEHDDWFSDSFDFADLKLVGARDLERFDWAGYAQFPYSNPGGWFGDDWESYIVLDTEAWWTSLDPRSEDGPFLVHLALHELGHALGLGHPHDGGNGTTAWTNEEARAGDDPLDNERFTVMSYERGGTDVSRALASGHAVTPMAIDIAALQHIYGANGATHAGDTTYRLGDPGFGPADGDGQDGSVTIGGAFYCIWDTGGVDTIRYDGGRSVLLALHDATLDRADPGAVDLARRLEGTDVRARLPAELERELLDPRINAGGFFSRIFDGPDGAAVLGGYSIAKGCVVEHAIGGAGDDVLIGNEQRNELTGGAGSDLLFGDAGDDLLASGAGADELWGGAGRDRFLGAPRDLDGDRIRDLSTEDAIVLSGVRFDRRNLVVEPGNAALRIDSDRNGVFETRIALEGDLGGSRFLVEPDPAGALQTAIRTTTAPNAAPVAVDDSVRIAYASPVLLDLLANDSDPDGFLDPASLRITASPAFGSVNVERDGRVTYVPDPGFAGETSFRYRVADLEGALSNEAEVRVRVEASAIDGTGRNDRIVGTAAADRVRGLAGNDRLFGEGGDDVLAGGAGKDRLSGGFGDDILVGGRDGDLLDGGPGIDVALFLGPSDGFRSASKGGKRTITALRGADGRDTLVGIERIQFEDGWLDTTTGTFRAGYASPAVETLLGEARSWLEG